MREKNGFVFLETVVVLIIVTLSLTMLLSSYSLLARKSKQNETYDNVSDKYLLYSISSLGTTGTYNYNVFADFSANAMNCMESPMSNIFLCNEVTSDRKTCLNNNCSNLFSSTGLVNLYLVSDIDMTLSDSSLSSKIDNGTIQYMKTLKACDKGGKNNGVTECMRCNKYIMGVFYRNGKYHYASVPVGTNDCGSTNGIGRRDPIIAYDPDSGKCTNGNSKCEGSTLLTCKTNKWISTVCNDGCKTNSSTSAECLPETCKNGNKKCSEDGKLLTCLNKEWVSTNCNNGCRTISAINASCIPDDCNNGEKICDGNKLLTCTNGSWINQTCSNGCTTIDATNAKCSDCVSGTSRCQNSNKLISCINGKEETQNCSFGCVTEGTNISSCAECANNKSFCDNEHKEFVKCEHGKWVRTPCNDCVEINSEQAVCGNCTNDTSVCSGGKLKVCSGGIWYEEDCAGNGCKTLTTTKAECANCKNGDKICGDNDKILTCTNGDWTESSCSSYKYKCYDDSDNVNDAYCANCLPDESMCQDKKIYKCENNNYVLKETCGNDYECDLNSSNQYYCKKSKYTIAFNANGGTGSMENLECTFDVNCTLTANAFTKSDYGFLGWSDSSSGDVLYTNGDTAVNIASGTSKTLYAVWKQENKNFAYTGNIQTFTAPYTGYYKLEVWGAQGGHNAAREAGYGGYSVGVIKLSEDEKLYVGVGGQGGSLSGGGSGTGGYNGGAKGGGWGKSLAGTGGFYYTLSASGGGGATHIATKNRGELKEYNSYRSEVIIVAGGGSGVTNCKIDNGDWYYDWAEYNCAHGGGYEGNSAKGAGGTQTTGCAFGKGCGDKAGRSGGGGGWYGGNTDGGWSGYGGSPGGGSGYIGNSRLVSYGGITKHMACYSCSTSNDTSIKTISVSNVSSSATADYAKKESGYAKISFISS